MRKSRSHMLTITSKILKLNFINLKKLHFLIKNLIFWEVQLNKKKWNEELATKELKNKMGKRKQQT